MSEEQKRIAMTWQPIETAPKDATIILGYSEHWIDPEFSLCGIRQCFYNGGYWSSLFWVDDDMNVSREGGDTPTHWHPLPEPPKP